jgi:hypothetical protein
LQVVPRLRARGASHRTDSIPEKTRARRKTRHRLTYPPINERSGGSPSHTKPFVHETTIYAGHWQTIFPCVELWNAVWERLDSYALTFLKHGLYSAEVRAAQKLAPELLQQSRELLDRMQAG